MTDEKLRIRRRAVLGGFAATGGGIAAASIGLDALKTVLVEDPREYAARLTAAGDVSNFGASIDLSGTGDVALVGSRAGGGPDTAGAAFLYRRVQGIWAKVARLEQNNKKEDTHGYFGRAVALDGDGTTALVGQPGGAGDDQSIGTAHVFTDSGGWSERARFSGDGMKQFHRYGEAVALSADGTTALVSAPYLDEPLGEDGGAVFVYRRSGGDWRREARLVPSTGDSEDHFGMAVALDEDGTTAVVGALQAERKPSERPEWDELPMPGAVFVFTRDDGDWTERSRLRLDRDRYLLDFGAGLALTRDGSRMVVGAPQRRWKGTDVPSGAAFVYADDGGSWHHESELTAEGGEQTIGFGSAVALDDDGTTALVRDGYGVGEDVQSSVCQFERRDGEWRQRSAFHETEKFNFGWDLALGGAGTTALLSDGPTSRMALDSVLVYYL